MQFNRLKDRSLELLPARHVDTGMGLERLVRVLQKKNSNYDTDLFTGTIGVVEKIVKKQYSFGDSKQDIAFRVLADHIRAISFTIADGQLPSNTDAGYVIRRILPQGGPVLFFLSGLQAAAAVPTGARAGRPVQRRFSRTAPAGRVHRQWSLEKKRMPSSGHWTKV
ncbi:alanine--tRNA ligase-related protein [Puia sp. P3]|uniref:alanine--tRNA ligase-related protein n=1 Tax=Puia sp. P3 TaxID=3423952 RepID=UPI003D667C0F